MNTPTGPRQNHDMLVPTNWLGERLTRRDIRIIDMGSYQGYCRAHIPGALHPGPQDKSHYLKDPDKPVHVLGPDKFSSLMGKLGIDSNTQVIAYDDLGGKGAARLWWCLAYYGHRKCKILDGGWDKWIEETRPVSGTTPFIRPKRFIARINHGLLCDQKELLELLRDPDVQLLDVRSEEEWLGTDTRGNKKSGHIPGSQHLHWKTWLDSASSMTIRPVQEIRRLLTRPSIHPNKTIITY